MFVPIEAEPAYIALDSIDISLLFLGRIGIVETQMTAPAKFLGNAEIETNRLGVTDVQVAIRLRGKAGDHLFDAPGIEIGLDDLTNEIAPGFIRIAACLIVGGHASSISSATNNAAYAMTCRSAQCQLR